MQGPRASCSVIIVLATVSLFLPAACGGGGGSSRDRTIPVTTLIAPTGGEIVSGVQSITWTTVDRNPGTVEIRVSNDSGTSYAILIDAAAPDTGSYTIDTTTVPDGSTYRVRLTPTDVANNIGAPSDSASDFTIDNTAPATTLTAPGGGETWGGTRNITWTTTDTNPNTVEVTLSTDSGATFPTVLAAAAPDTGSYSWDTTAHVDANRYRVRLIPTDLAGNVGAPAGSASDFELDNTAPTTTLLSPVGGEIWSGGNGIGWLTTESNPGTVEITLSTDSGVTFTTTIATGVNDLLGLYGWDTTTTPDSRTARIRVTPTDGAGNVGAPADSPADLTVDNSDPVTNLTAPVGGEVWGGIRSITWTTTDANPDRVEVRLSTDSGTTWPTVLAAAAPDTGTFVWDTTGGGDTALARIRVTPTDLAGNAGASSDSAADFAIDNTPPVTVLNGPIGGEIVGGMQTIIWSTADANPGTVEIRASDDSGTTYGILVDPAAPDTGTCLVDTSIVPDGSTYRIRLIPTDLGANVGGTSDSPSDFTIDNTVPVTDLTSPVGGENWTGVQTITWTTTDANPGTVEIRLSSDSGTTYPVVIEPAAPDTGVYAWDTSAQANSATLRIRLTPTDLASNPGAPSDSPLDFTIATPPAVTGLARFIDVDMDGLAGPGDMVIVPFDRDVVVNAAAPTDLTLPVTGDDFGTGAIVLAGPGANEVTITLGTTPFLKSRQTFDPAKTLANDPSGIDVSAAMAADAIEDASGGVDAIPSNPVDLIPAFVDAQTLTDAGGRVVMLADLDRDGDLDIVGAQQGSGNVVWLNDGSGVFTDSGQSLGTGETLGAALGDVNGDGFADLIAGNLAAGNRVWLNDGSGTLVDSGQSLGTAFTNSIASGDVDKDGDVDFVAGNLAGPNRVWLNDGSGTFADSGQALGSSDTLSVVLGDLDRDGDLDLVVGNFNGQPDRVWRNDGTGTFTDSGQVLGSSDTCSVALGDVDRDGDLDLVVGNTNNQPDAIWLNDGTGLLSDSGQSLGAENTHSVELADYDSDGDLDFIAGVLGQPNRVRLNDGTGVFTDSGLALGNGDTYSLALGDIDKDGDLDVVEVNEGADIVWKNSLSGTWGTSTFTDSGQALGSSDWAHVVLGDLDSDGDLDFIEGWWNQPNVVWLNDGAGTFTDSGQALGGGETFHLVLGDLDDDGDLDFIEARWAQPNLVWLNDGAANFTDSGQTLGSGDTECIALGDVDSDGDLDLIAGNSGQPDLVWLNDGAGNFTDSGQTLGNTETDSVALGDLDADGDLDLVTTNYLQADRVWFNDGLGTFILSGQTLGSDSRSAGLADLDSDGDIDIFFGIYGQPNLVWLNDGAGNFTDSGQTLGANRTEDVALGDVDGDGDIDCVEGVSFNLPLQVWLNDGAANFTDSGQTLGAGWTSAVALGDLDSDGDLDLVEGTDTGQPARIWLNE